MIQDAIKAYAFDDLWIITALGMVLVLLSLFGRKRMPSRDFKTVALVICAIIVAFGLNMAMLLHVSSQPEIIKQELVFVSQGRGPEGLYFKDNGNNVYLRLHSGDTSDQIMQGHYFDDGEKYEVMYERRTRIMVGVEW